MSSNEAEYWKVLLDITNAQRNIFIQRHKNRLAAGDETASDELTYGELTLDGCFALLDDAQMRSAATERGKPYRFLDLGSGTGKLIFAAIRVLPELRGVGVELSLERHAAACEVRDWHIQSFPTFNYSQRLTFINGDASCAVGPIRWADTIWISNLLFPSWLNERIAHLIDLWAEQDTFVYSQKPLPLQRRYPDCEDECVLCNVTWQQNLHLVKVDRMCGVPPAYQVLREPARETNLEECFLSWVDRSHEQQHGTSEQATERPASIIPNLDVLKAALTEALLKRVSSENLIKRLYADDGDLQLICSQAFLRSRRKTRRLLGTGGVDLATFTNIFKSCEERLPQSTDDCETMQHQVEALPEETVLMGHTTASIPLEFCPDASPHSVLGECSETSSSVPSPSHDQPHALTSLAAWEPSERGAFLYGQSQVPLSLTETDDICLASVSSKAGVNSSLAPPPEFLSCIQSVVAAGKTSNSSRSQPEAQPKVATKQKQLPIRKITASQNPHVTAMAKYLASLTPFTETAMTTCEDMVEDEDKGMPENLTEKMEEAWPSLGPRVRKALRTYAYFDGDLPAEEAENEWSDAQLDTFFASNGFIVPKQRPWKQRLK